VITTLALQRERTEWRFIKPHDRFMIVANV